MSLPRVDFLIIGAQKCGTSWLHARLREHPGLFLPDDKDDEYLSWTAHLDDAGRAAAFAARFAEAPGDRLAGDACASYLWTTEPRPEGFNPDLPATAKRLFGPGLKVIVLLRDPVERAVSAYLHHLRHAGLDWNTGLLDAPVGLGLLELGRYGDQVAAWADALGADRVRVLPAPGSAAAADILAAACDFLGVPTPGGIDDEPVYPGLERLRDPRGGVWVRSDDPDLAEAPPPARPMPLERREGRPWVRVVHPAELAAARKRLAPDTVALARWLTDHDQQHPALAAWLPGRA